MRSKDGPTATSPIGPDTSVREAVTRYPGIEAVFEKHGLMGCGGPSGPLEAIAFFAHVHQADPVALLQELNDFATRSGKAQPLPLSVEAPERRRNLYFIGVAVSLSLAVLAGFPLGILVALGAVHDVGLGTRWTPLVQAHGHLQVAGWVGLFIVGIAYHVLPRFKGIALKLPFLTLPSIALIASGVVLRTLTQPWADTPWIAGLMTASGALELAGGTAFAGVVVTTIWSARREAYDAFLIAASLWLVAASVANLALLVDLTAGGNTVIPSDKDAPLLAMQFFGFITLFIFGISLRVLPAFLNLRPPLSAALGPILLLFNIGLLLRVGTGWIDAYSGWARPDAVESSSVYLVAAAVLAYVFALNIHLPSMKSDTADPQRGYAKLIRAAYVWLAVTMGVEIWFATKALLSASTPNFLEAGSARHALALGFMTQMIFGVGARALPVFAGKRLYSQRLLDVTFVFINLAAVVRVGNALVETGSAKFRFDSIAVSGSLALLAVLLFGYNIVRSVRAETVEPSPEREGGEMEEAGEAKRFVISRSTVVADVLERVPGALELLISYGFTPLKDPTMRHRLTPHVTLEMASQIHSIDLDALIGDLNRLMEQASPAPAGGNGLDEEKVMEALRGCYDPEIPANIVDLGLVYEVRVDGKHAYVKMTLTAPDCPLAGQIVAEVTEAIRSVGFEEVDVELVREPPWQPSRMSAAARAALGWQ